MEPGMISCPECGAPAEIREKNATPCHTWEAIHSGWMSFVTEAEEVLLIVEVLCAAGHRFSGPTEMLDGDNEMDAWQERTA